MRLANERGAGCRDRRPVSRITEELMTTITQALLSTRRSEALWQEARAHAPMGAQGEGKYYAPYPLFIDRARGARLWDADGNEYIDYWSGAGPCVLGHSHPDVNQA